VIILPFIVLHWIVNDNTCALTVAERYLRKNVNKNNNVDISHDDCITCQLIEPVYDFKNNYKSFSKTIYTATFILWSIGVLKLYFKYKTGKINKFSDLFLI